MKILSVQQIRDIDAYTIQHKPIASIDLMENAAKAIFEWISRKFDKPTVFHIICGGGNNGGDGLALGRILIQNGYAARIYLPEMFTECSADNLENQKRLKEKNIPVERIENTFSFTMNDDDVIVDALFGSGLNREIEGETIALIESMNHLNNKIISIDIPSGLFADKPNQTQHIIQAEYTLAFEIPKLAFLLPQNEKFVGEWQLLQIGLMKEAIEKQSSENEIITEERIRKIYRPRKKFSHKGTFGHALLIAGSYGKTGAAVLATKAALKAGSGLVSCYVPESAYQIIQTAVPEAMTITDKAIKFISESIDLKPFNAIGIGPGLGTHEETQIAFEKILHNLPKESTLVLDADALNILAQNKALWSLIPENTILTPHPKEFERLAGPWRDDFHRLELQREFSRKYKVIIVLKGAHSSISGPDGQVYFNNTGNPGMATGGSGDELTGIITGLLAQGYEPLQAAILGVYLHGLAGDIAAAKISQESLTASDLIDFLGKAFLQISSLQKS